MMHPGAIYFVRPVGMVGPIKIGCTVNIEERLSTLSAWSPFKLECIYRERGDVTLERRIHRAFSEYHSHREWFHPGIRLMETIGRLMAGQTLAQAVDFSFDGPDLPAMKPRRSFSVVGVDWMRRAEMEKAS